MLRTGFNTSVGMKIIRVVSVFSVLLILFFINTGSASGQQEGEHSWKAGVARAIITPEEPVWMAGYASRDRASEGTLVDLWVKVLAVEDAKGKKAILITMDLLGIPKKISDRIRNQIGIRYGLTRSQIILSCSHTHTGPVLMDALFDIYPLNDKEIDAIRKYSESLEKKIISLAGEALQSMVPARLFSGNGVTRFQVNRRNNSEAELAYQTSLSGPNDFAVPVLKVLDPTGKMIAVVFGYACHATVLNINQFSGDYPGFAQKELEKLYPGTTAMFFQGAGADQNPLPRRTVPLALQYGRELAAAVDRVLTEDMREQQPLLSTAYSEIDLPFSILPSEDELMKTAAEATGYQQQWAVSQLDILRKNGSLPASYPYPVQVWNLGDQPILILGGELVIQYAIELKKIFGTEIFVIGYANDGVSYIPSETILKEGGYEGESSQMVYGMPAKWEYGIESLIIEEVKNLAEKAGIEQLINKQKTSEY
jgi:hypothetical protein